MKASNNLASPRPKLVQRLRLAAIVILAMVLVPYGFSRIVSPWRKISVHALTGVPPGSTETEDKDEHIRIATYNIAHGRGLAESNWQGGKAEERTLRLRQIADLLKDLNADIVVLNEVDFDCSWSLSANQARALAEQAGYPYWSEQRNLDFRVLNWTWRFGNAILSKYPILEARAIDLPSYSAVETIVAGQKRALLCTPEKNEKRLQVIAVHLCHRSEAIRVQSAKVIENIIASSEIPTIIAGDFNSMPTGFANSTSDNVHGNAMDAFDASKLVSRHPETPNGMQEELTYHATKPDRTIDWVLVPKSGKFRDYRVIASTLSDHRPVVADVLLP
jgi:endonuclease/exonuclease/phosphatase family metal-dependent hydrolase